MFQHFVAEKTDAGLDFDIEVEPGKRVYCFFGRNGAGKTSLLENWGRTLLWAHTTAVHPATPNARFAGLFRKADIRPVLETLPFRLPEKTLVDGRGANHGLGPGSVATLAYWDTPRPHGLLVDRPIVAIGARDRGFAENLSTDRVKLLGSHASRFVQSYLRTYRAVTRQPVETESLAEWLAARLIVNPAFARSDDRSFEVETMLRLMEELEPKLFAGISAKTADGSLPAIHFSDGRLWLRDTPLDKLPSGFISIMKLFQEILGGFAGWTAFQDVKDLGAVDGIVLIDEIEAHLHPTWQAKIVPLLKRFFPQATFYLCTHSPLIVATTEEGEAYELVREDQRVTAKKLGNPRAWYLADVYEQAFHVELPSADEGASVPDLLLDFSLKVKDHLRTKDPAIAEEARALYERIVPSVPATDPRRASLDELRKMVA
jgi:hypothetical protein